MTLALGRAMQPRVRSLLLFVTLLGACTSHEVPVPARYADPGGNYRIDYTSPPWRIRSETPGALELEVPSNAETFLGVVDAGEIVPPKYLLAISVVSGAPEASTRAEETAAVARGERLVVATRAITTTSLDSGFEVVTRTEDTSPRYVRTVFLAHPSGSLKLRFEGSPELDNPELDAMIATVDVL